MKRLRPVQMRELLREWLGLDKDHKSLLTSIASLQTDLRLAQDMHRDMVARGVRAEAEMSVLKAEAWYWELNRGKFEEMKAVHMEVH
jgi:hypothetical protein